MRRPTRPVNCAIVLAALAVGPLLPATAWAQGVMDDASTSAPSGSVAPVMPVAPAPTSVPTATSTSESAPRTPRGPSVRERGGRRSRGASTASGALFIVILVGAIGYYVMKRIRR